MHLLRYLLLFCLIVSLSGCAFTTDKVPLNYKFNASTDKTKYSKTYLPIYIDKIIDNRQENNPNLIVHKRNGYLEATTGGYEAEKPIADILRQGLTSGLQQAGFTVLTRPQKYILSGSIESTEMKVIIGILQGSIEIDTQVNLKVINKLTGKTLWQNAYTGRGRVKSANLEIAKAFNQSLTDIISQVQSSDSLYIALH